MRRYYNIPLTLIFKCNQDEQLLSLYYFYKLRNIHRNNTFYNANYSNLSRILKLSRPSVKAHLQVMINNGWVSYDSYTKILKLKGITALNNSYHGKIIQVPICTSRKHQLARFRYAIMHLNLQKQQYSIDRKARILKIMASTKTPLSKKDYKFYRRNFKSPSHLEKSLIRKITLSNKSIGNIFNRSQKTGATYQAIMRDFGIIKSIPRYKVLLRNISYETYLQYKHSKDYPKQVVFRANKAVKQFSNEIVPNFGLSSLNQKEKDLANTGEKIQGDAIVVGNKYSINSETSVK